jgi:hypothetical protein
MGLWARMMAGRPSQSPNTTADTATKVPRNRSTVYRLGSRLRANNRRAKSSPAEFGRKESKKGHEMDRNEEPCKTLSDWTTILSNPKARDIRRKSCVRDRKLRCPSDWRCHLICWAFLLFLWFSFFLFPYWSSFCESRSLQQEERIDFSSPIERVSGAFDRFAVAEST